MALDTKYRPRVYNDVIGQGATVSILKQYVKGGRGFHQSYVFCGQRGSGKTTLGRILARALLCSSPVDGEPCDRCGSCTALLNGEDHECFEELDAATRSSKADLIRIVEDSSYSSFSGKRKIWIFDESHRLSKQALDSLLKSMEDNVPGSEDKQLVCIFCTTEPEKMADTIFSRCAPAFVIRAVEPEIIAERLSIVCESEGIPHELEALTIIADINECHIRDALKSVEGLSLNDERGITRESVANYFRLGANVLVFDLLESVANTDRVTSMELSSRICHEVGPKSSYERLSEASMVVYKYGIGVGKLPHMYDAERVKALFESKGEILLDIASLFSNPPHKPSSTTFGLDCVSMGRKTTIIKVETESKVKDSKESKDTKEEVASEKIADLKKSEVTKTAALTPTGIYVDPRAVNKSESNPSGYNNLSMTKPSVSTKGTIDRSTFRQLLQVHIRSSKIGSRT